jgi:hypothetical protein
LIYIKQPEISGEYKYFPQLMSWILCCTFSQVIRMSRHGWFFEGTNGGLRVAVLLLRIRWL